MWPKVPLAGTNARSAGRLSANYWDYLYQRLGRSGSGAARCNYCAIAYGKEQDDELQPRRHPA